MSDAYKGNEFRPVTVQITSTFPKRGARKVTPNDLHNAGMAAAMAFRAHLEARSPAYEVLDLEFSVEYSYVQWSSREEL